MTAFLITPDIREEVARAVEQARANVIPWEKLKDHVHDDRAAPTATLSQAEKGGTEWRPPSQHVIFPGGITAAISFEEQPAGILRHASFATSKRGQDALPNPVFLQVLCEIFGFREFPPRAGRVWIEEYKPDHWAVNVVEVDTPRDQMPAVGHA